LYIWDFVFVTFNAHKTPKVCVYKN